MESCQKCGHIRYAGDLFDGGCSDCCDWMVARLAELTAERDALKAKLAEAKLERIRVALSRYLKSEDRPQYVDALKAKVEAVATYGRECAEAARTTLPMSPGERDVFLQVSEGLDAILNDAREGGE